MTRVKICGIARLADAEHAVEAGAWALGLIFADSPRACPPAEAARISAAVRRRVALAGVFVNAPLDEVVRTADELSLDLLQLHGDEGPAYCAAAAHRTGARVVKAARIGGKADLQALDAFRLVDFHLVDGAGGVPFDWGLLAERRAHVPLIVAGGLTPDNVADAVAATRPWAVDSASGTEAAPGVKDPDLVEAFIARAQAAAAAPHEAPR